MDLQTALQNCESAQDGKAIDLDSQKMNDYTADEALLFKDSIKDGTYGRPSKSKQRLISNKSNDVLVLDDDESENTCQIYDRNNQILPQIKDGKIQ